ncbi:2',5'-phosphodiesterase 12 [Glossina fuscipes]|uniref:2',5'-phosphodiesterase 12 n=1 Tax=Glossina fuscipes TaxID=7396 RepID=A0A9C5Z0P9_9MUSC|nr:2',5'-phosphodiesterase 12 [Glossina fuscipes]
MVLQLLERRQTFVFFPVAHIFASVAKRFICQSYLRIATRAHHTNSPMDKVYFRNDSHSEELHINFRYVNADLKLDREFNFCRRMSEKVEDALTRIRGNIEKEIFKKAKKTKNKSLPQESELSPKPLVDGKIELLRGEHKLADITFIDILGDTTDSLNLRILDRNFQVVINQPWVVNLVMPTIILAGFTVYPSKLEMQFAERSYCKGSWFKAKMPASGNLKQVKKWLHCGDGLSYNTCNEDVGYFLKLVLIPGNSQGQFGPLVEQISKGEVQVGPGRCPFETRHCFTKQRLGGDSLRIVSYNVLADLYADSDYSRTHLFPYCPAYALKADYRKQLILKEIMGYNADIICLQEVDVKFFNFDLQPILEDDEQAFKGLLAQKGTCGEGVATFYNAKRFDLFETRNFNIGENIKVLTVFRGLWQKIQTNEKLAERICDRSTTLQLTLLKMKECQYYLLVANTHLYFHPDADHIRLLQIGLSMLYIEDMYRKLIIQLNLNDENQLAIVFSGDFNSVPECGIFRLMTEGFVEDDFIDWRSNPEEALTGVFLKQPFRMQSACGTPQYTNFTHAFAACLDYIFYQSDRLSVEQIVPLPGLEELKSHKAIPSVVFPSDHVALVADLRFKLMSQNAK